MKLKIIKNNFWLIKDCLEGSSHKGSLETLIMRGSEFPKSTSAMEPRHNTECWHC